MARYMFGLGSARVSENKGGGGMRLLVQFARAERLQGWQGMHYP